MNGRMWTAAAAALFAVLGAGCAGTPEEILRESDITVQELEVRKNRSIDPEGRYARAKSSILRQEVITEQGWLEPPLVQMIEIKYSQPGNFKMTTYLDNQPQISLIVNGKLAWLANYREKTVQPMEPEELDSVRQFTRITEPGTKLVEVFPKIEIKRCRIQEEEYYKLICHPREGNPINLYIDAKEYLPRRLTSLFELEDGRRISYDSTLLRYSLYEGVRIPDETEITQNGRKQSSKVVYYKLDTFIDPADFRPPVF